MAVPQFLNASNTKKAKNNTNTKTVTVSRETVGEFFCIGATMKNTQTHTNEQTRTDYEAFCTFLKTGQKNKEGYDEIDDVMADDESFLSRLLRDMEIEAVMADNAEAITLKMNKKEASDDEYFVKSEGSELFELFCANELSKLSGIPFKIKTTKEEQINIGDTELVEIKNDKMSKQTDNFYFELYEKKVPKRHFWSKGSTQKLGKDGYAQFIAIGTEDEFFILHKNVIARGLVSDVDKKEYKVIKAGTSVGFAIPKKRVMAWVLSSEESEPCAVFRNGVLYTKTELAGEKLIENDDINYVEKLVSETRKRQAEALNCDVNDLEVFGEKCLKTFHDNPEHTEIAKRYDYNGIKEQFLKIKTNRQVLK